MGFTIVEHWPPIRVKRFEGESMGAYERRAAEIVDIITGFRELRFRGALAEQKERRLMMLQEPHLELA